MHGEKRTNSRKWTSIPCGLALLALFGALVVGCPASGRLYKQLEHDGRVRTYQLTVPSNYVTDTPVPLLIVLHGGGGSADQIAQFTGFDALAEQNGFIVAYPNAINLEWNDGRGAKGLSSQVSNIDDVGFISTLIDALRSDYAIDNARVYVTGASNGGMMTLRLGCALSDKLAAIAPVIASLPEPLAGQCLPVKPLPILMINGLDDMLVPYGGGQVVPMGFEDRGRVIPVEQTIAFWGEANGCAAAFVQSDLPDLDPGDGTTVWKREYVSCADGSEAILYGVVGGGHNWPGAQGRLHMPWMGKISNDIDATALIWEFFQRHKRE